MKKLRADSFFGLHFDFHASPGQTGIGENTDGDAIGEMLEAVRPDYVQCDTKGHPGVSSYPTKVGRGPDEPAKDILRIWRDATEERDVALYAHHSGILDAEVAKSHPEWASVNAKGENSPNGLSVFGPYASEYLATQLIEMAVDYRLDGAWVDGECWGLQPDYSEWAAEAYREKFDEDLPQPGTEDYPKFERFMRDGFKEYVKRYMTAVKREAPAFEITSNWMYTSYIPEEPVVPIDWISGDYSPNNSLNSVRFEGRCIQNQGKPWDLMCWGFSHGPVEGVGLSCVKEYSQLCQEAAGVIMLGGGFQIYNRQPKGDFQRWNTPTIAKVAEFARAREELCWRSKPVPQIAVVYSAKSYYTGNPALFHVGGSKAVRQLKGTLFALLDAGFSAEVLMNYMITSMPADRLDSYKAIVVPDCVALEGSLKTALTGYAERGGKLIVVGCESTAQLLPYLDVDITGGSAKPASLFLREGERCGCIPSPYYRVRTISGSTVPFGSFNTSDYDESNPCIAATVADYGAGKAAGVYFDLGSYNDCRTAVVCDFIRSFVTSLCTPDVEFECDYPLEVAYMEKNGRLLVNLLNRMGDHADTRCRTAASLPPARDVTVRVRLPEPPKSVSLEPEGTAVPIEWEAGVLTVKIDRIDVHAVVAIEP